MIIHLFVRLFLLVQAEVIFLGQLRHPHLVKLIGYCYQDEHRLLVYEFMARGSLEKHLFKSRAGPNSLGVKANNVRTFLTIDLFLGGNEQGTLLPFRGQRE